MATGVFSAIVDRSVRIKMALDENAPLEARPDASRINGSRRRRQERQTGGHPIRRPPYHLLSITLQS
jgi:hypothetical protein